MKIKEIITPKPQSVSPDTTLMEAAGDMKALDMDILLVCEDEFLVGILTDRDITVRAIAEGYDPKTTRVRDVMSRVVVSCFEDQDVQEAAELMERSHVRRLPVLDRAEHLVGIVSLENLCSPAMAA